MNNSLSPWRAGTLSWRHATAAGVDSFTYVANDGVQNSNIAKVAVIVEPGIVTFSEAIDGSDYLHIQGDQFCIVHRNYYPAGQYPGIPDHNLYVDGVPGNTDTVWTISPTLADATPVVAISDGRGDVTVTQQPSASNGYETIVLINDDPEFGPWWYDVAVMAASYSPPTVLVAPSSSDTVAEGQTLQVSPYLDPRNLLVGATSSNGAVTGLSVAQVTDGNPNASGRQLTVNADGSFTYTPPAGFTGTDWFTYKLIDSAGDPSTLGSAVINVTPVTSTMILTVGGTTDPAPSSDPQDTPFIPIDDGYDSDDQTTPNDELTVPDASDPELVPASLTMNANASMWGTWSLSFPNTVRVFQVQNDGSLTAVTSDQQSAPIQIGGSPLSFEIEGVGPAGAAAITATLTPVSDPNGNPPPVTQPTTRSVGVNVGAKPLQVLSVSDNSPGSVLTVAQAHAGVFVPISNPGLDLRYRLPLNISDLQEPAALQVPKGWAVINGITDLSVPLNPSGQVILQPSANLDVPYFVEDDASTASGANTPVQISLSRIDNNNQVQGRVGSLGSFTVTPFIRSSVGAGTKYIAAGPGNVPQYGKYEYNVTPLKGGASQWLDPDGGRMTVPTNNSNDVYIQWIPGADGAPFEGEAIFEATPQYIWEMPVNVMTITVTATNPFATDGDVTGFPGTAQGAKSAGLGKAFVTVQSDLITWKASITVAEPAGPLHGGGAQKLRIGFVQNLQVAKFRANYGATAPGTSSIATQVGSGNDVESPIPYWDTQDRDGLASASYPDQFYDAKEIFKVGPSGGSKVLSSVDRPFVSVPRSNGHDLQSTTMAWNLTTFVAAMTTESPSVYVAQASAAWTFNGTGTFSVATQKWTKTGAAVTPPTNNQWARSDENSIQPITTGTRFNDIAEGNYRWR